MFLFLIELHFLFVSSYVKIRHGLIHIWVKKFNRKYQKRINYLWSLLPLDTFYFIRLFLLLLLVLSLLFFCINLFFINISFSSYKHSPITGLRGKGGGHPLHRHLDISRAITAESSPLRVASSWTQTGKLWFPSASH